MRNEEAATLIQGEANPPSPIRHPQLTAPGTVMGTVAYMSPEQVRGEEVDHRSDIFSFGLILYEMLAGRRAFDRQSFAETMAAIANEEAPELSELNPKVTPQLDKIVRHCLEKKPEMRFQSARDLGFALEAMTTPTSSSANRTEAVSALTPVATTKRSGWVDRLAWIVAGLMALTALAMTVAYFKRSATSPRAVRLSFTPPENLAFDNGRNDEVEVSPDGQKIVFTGRAADGKRQLYVRALEAAEATLLPGTDDPLEPFWSPDSRSIGFSSQGKLKRVDLAGGRAQTLCDVTRFYGGSWNRDGVILFAPSADGGLFQIPATGGEPKQVTKSGVYPCFLPNGRHFVFRGTRGVSGSFIGSLDSPEVKQLLTDGVSTIFAPPEWLLYVRNGVLFAQTFAPERLALSGDPLPLTPPTNDTYISGTSFSASENGVLIWQGDRHLEYQLLWFDRAGNQVGAVGSRATVLDSTAPQLSPDGRQVLLHRTDLQTRNSDLWAIDLARNLPNRLTFNPAEDAVPIWSPDGSSVVFESVMQNARGLYQKAAKSSGNEDLLLKTGDCAPNTWSKDGRFLIYNLRTEKHRRDILALPMFGDRQPYPLLNSEFDEYRAQVSADGRWMAYVSDESGSYEIYVQSFTADGKLGGNKQRISTNGGNQPRFSRNGRELFYVAADGMMMAVALKPSSATFEFEPPKALFKTRMFTGRIQSGIEYDVTADGQRFLIGTQVGEPSPVSVILNWTEGLKK
jgi:Tol biopolymer transport system component